MFLVCDMIINYFSPSAGKIFLKSKLEVRIARILDLLYERRIYKNWSYEKQIIRYKNGDGRFHNYYVDFKVIDSNSNPFFIEGKGKLRENDIRKLNAAKGTGVQLYLLKDEDVSQWEKDLFISYKYKKALI